MATKTDDILRKLLAGALTLEGFIQEARSQYHEKMDLHAREFQLDSADAAFFRDAVRQPGGPATVLLVGEDWCPDVHRGLAVVRGIAEASGMELRVLERDAWIQQALEPFPGRGGVPRIPTVFFLDGEGRLLAHWIERPQQAHGQMGAWEDQDRHERTDRTVFMLDHRVEWRQETVREMRETLRG